MPASRTSLIFAELPERVQPVVRRGDRGRRRRRRRRGTPRRGTPWSALAPRDSTPIAAESHAGLAGGDDRCRRSRYHPTASAKEGGRGVAPAAVTEHLSPRLSARLSVPLLPMPRTRGPHSHKRSARGALVTSEESESESGGRVAPRRAAPRRTAPHRTAPHHTAPHRTRPLVTRAMPAARRFPASVVSRPWTPSLGATVAPR